MTDSLVGATVLATGTVTSATIAYPTGLVAGDLLELLWGYNPNSGSTTVTDPTGWTFVAERVYSTTHRARYYQRTSDGTESGSSITLAVSVGHKYAAAIQAHRGVTRAGYAWANAASDTTDTIAVAAVATTAGIVSTFCSLYSGRGSTPPTSFLQIPGVAPSSGATAFGVGGGAMWAANAYDLTADTDNSVGTGNWQRDNTAASGNISLTVGYNAAPRITKTISTSWNVAVRATKGQVTTWTVRQRLPKTTATTWTVRQRFAKTTSTSWDVISSTRVPKTVSTTWSVRARPIKTTGVSYTVRQRLPKTTATTWTVRVRVVKPGTSTTWSIRARVNKVSSSTTWAIRARITSQTYASWDTLAIVYTPQVTGLIWNGTAWVTVPIKRWSGTIWKPVVIKKWNGGSWVNIS